MLLCVGGKAFFGVNGSVVVVLCRGEPRTWSHGLGSRFWFHVNPVSHPLPLNHYLFHRPIPYRPLRSRPLNPPPVNRPEHQLHAAATVPQHWGTVQVLSWRAWSVQCTYVFRDEQELVNNLFMLYVFHFLLSNKFLLLRWSVTGTYNELLLLWWCVTGTLTELLFLWCCVTGTQTQHPQEPVQRQINSLKYFFI